MTSANLHSRTFGSFLTIFLPYSRKKLFSLKIVSGNVCDERESFRFYFGILLRWMSLLGTRAEDVYANCPKNHYNIWGLRPMSREGTAIYMPATNQWCARQNVVLDISQLYFIATFFFLLYLLKHSTRKCPELLCVCRGREGDGFYGRRTMHALPKQTFKEHVAEAFTNCCLHHSFISFELPPIQSRGCPSSHQEESWCCHFDPGVGSAHHYDRLKLTESVHCRNSSSAQTSNWHRLKSFLV